MKTLKYICLALCAMVAFACSDDDPREAQRSECQPSLTVAVDTHLGR